MPVNPIEKTSNDSSGTSDPYMHLVDDLFEKGSDYSYKASEDDGESETEAEQSDAASGASPIMPLPSTHASVDMPGPSETGQASPEEDRRKRMDRMDSALADKELQLRSRFAAWRAAQKNRKQKASAAAAPPEVPTAATVQPNSPEPKSLYTALSAAPTSPFDAGSQAAGPRSRSMQPLHTRLDSALDYTGRGTDLRIFRSELLLRALPSIASPARSLQEPDGHESGAGSSRSTPLVQQESVFATAASGTGVSMPSPERLPRMDSCDLVFTTPPLGDPNPMAVLATLCQSVQSLAQMPFVGVLLLEDETLTSLLHFSIGCDPLKAALNAGFIESLLEPQALDILAVEDTLQQPRLKSHPAVLEPPSLRFYAAVPLVATSGLRLGFLYIADLQPRQLEKELVPALKNFAKATTKRLDKMGVAGRIMERRREAVSAMEPWQEPQLLVDTASANWRVLHANAAAQERFGGLSEGSSTQGLWEVFAAIPQTQDEGPSALVPSGLGEKIIGGRNFALRVRQQSASPPADLTLSFRPAPSSFESSEVQPIYTVGVVPERASQAAAKGTVERGALSFCGVNCRIW